ncbi:MAG: AraC family transcriptional regulator [Lachnospiraceae bacterium]
MQINLQNIQIVPKTPRGTVFEQREGAVCHTPYQLESEFYSCIERGEVTLLEDKMQQYFQDGFVIGRLSNNDLRQMQYWAVSSITLAVRAAIRGGLDELYAYNLSDYYIQYVDALQSTAQIVDLLTQKAVELTELVAKVHGRLQYSPHVRRCIGYIERHLHEKLTVAALAENGGITADYLSAIFKRETGEVLSTYILKVKLREAKLLLENGCNCEQTAYTLSFCSESYFISCFKKAFGITPRAYAAAHTKK